MELGDKYLMKVWNHDRRETIEAVGTYDGGCDHPDWGWAHCIKFDSIEGIEAEQWMSGDNLIKRIVEVL